MSKRKIYWSHQPWIKWLCPLPLLIYFSKKYMGGSHVWYRDNEYVVEFKKWN